MIKFIHTFFMNNISTIYMNKKNHLRFDTIKIMFIQV